MRALLFFTLTFLSGSASVAQSRIEIKGIVTDSDGHPVPGVRIFFKSNSKNKKVTGADGNYSIEMASLVADSLKFESVMFDDVAVYISQRQIDKALKTGVIVRDIVMPDRLLPMPVVLPEAPDTLVGTQEFFVSDFAFDGDSNLILLTYEQNLQKGSRIRLMDRDFREIGRFVVPDEAIELQTDWRHRVHLICENSVFWIRVVDAELQIYIEDREIYFKSIAPVIDTIGSLVYYSNYSDVYPAFVYLEYDLKDSVHDTLLHVEDTETMEFYRAEFKYLDNRTKVEMADLQIQTGIDKEIWAGALYYTKSLYYKPIYAPLFKLNEDTVLIFDHYKNLMFAYSPDKGITDSVRISYHFDERRTGWEEPLIQDPVTRKIYAVFQRSGYTYLYEINHRTGAVENSFRLYYKYVDGLQVRNGKAMYIYRPYESIQNKYLYGENISRN